MKAIKRVRPPPRPAGIDRVSEEGKLRWEADSFRFPPYQYAERFVIWVGAKWGLISASERELLHGLGYDHTILCWHAGDIRKAWQGFEDQRKTLVGDSFNCFSFSYVAAMLCQRWVPVKSYATLWGCAGMAPAFFMSLACADTTIATACLWFNCKGGRCLPTA